MFDTSKIDYSLLDRTEILDFLFYPRPEIPGFGYLVALQTAFSWALVEDLLIPVEEKVSVGARFHMKEKSLPNILFFHGNGEIAADYTYLGATYNHMDINFMPVDYRGYGRSTGNPTVTAIMRDSHRVFEFVTNWLEEGGYTGPLIVMGRSLGSAPALELAASYKDCIDGLIIESGFAHVIPLLKFGGINADALGLRKGQGFQNVDKIRTYDKPTLIVHAEWDQTIPFSDGQELYDACSSKEKELVKIPWASHFDLFLWNLPFYLSAVKAFVERIKQKRGTMN